MAKSPGKAPTTTAPKPAAIAKPKAPKKTAGNGADIKPAAAKAATMPTKAAATPTKAAAKPAKSAAKPAKPAKIKIKTKAESKSVFSETSSKISKLAADILADRIVPTIEQIKAIAASALGQDVTKGKKAKAKKKK